MIIAEKPCRFGGTDYRIGDEVPEDVIDSGMLGALIRMEILKKSYGYTTQSEPLNLKVDTTPAQSGGEGGDPKTEYSDADLKKMKVSELQEIAATRGLVTDGLQKADIISAIESL